MLTESDKNLLRQVAWNSIRYGVKNNHRLDNIELSNYSEPLNQPGASFVSLHKQSELRGCIGSLQATDALVIDVNHNANAAAFSDPRFNPLQASELELITLEISVLGPASEIQFSSEQDLIQQLKPNVDGLILTDKHHRATFLPVVWRQLPEPKIFLTHLKQKAGLAVNYWSETIKIERYSTISF